MGVPGSFSLQYKGETIWVLIVNINPGGPNGGSAAQYFIGQFDGKTFIPYRRTRDGQITDPMITLALRGLTRVRERFFWAG